MKGRLIVAALAVVVACGCAASASAAERPDRPTSARQIPDVTEMWSSPGAVWIARQLRQVNPGWGIAAADLDALAREWCSPYTRTAIQRLVLALPGADLRALPALSQLVQALRASCYASGQYAGHEIDYWTHVTAGNLMTLVRINVQRQTQTARYAWKRPAPPLPAKVSRAIQPAVPIACRAVGGIASSWLAKATLKGPVGWAALAGLSVAKAACPAVLNSAIARIL
jgi:hypothetical protein